MKKCANMIPLTEKTGSMPRLLKTFSTGFVLNNNNNAIPDAIGGMEFGICIIELITRLPQNLNLASP
ncbi:hypothetical protein CSCA_0466 [Clostridium scatologenes]|uniref:Uncharacterized protein n=1 Tax=Clostridium scatologenes TaxID=1548 RepID=A0A0E3GPX7_CLOSL|nr:hypothetical protein CSCA_0466 [Clostridium scatologenes]